MASNLTITISKKGAALALASAISGAGLAVLIDELFFDDYREYGYALQQPESSSERSTKPNNVAEANSENLVEAEVKPGRISPDEAMRIAEQVTGGRAIDIYPGFEAGRNVFYVDVRSGIGFREVYVDALTGEVIKIERGL